MGLLKTMSGYKPIEKTSKFCLLLIFMLGICTLPGYTSPASIQDTSQQAVLISTAKLDNLMSKGNHTNASFSGNVSWYGPGFQGKRTANGEIFDIHKKTAAHKSLPFFTRVQVEDPKTGKVVIVKINDRGPYVRNRVLDLSRGAAVPLGLLKHGVIYANCLVLSR